MQRVDVKVCQILSKVALLLFNTSRYHGDSADNPGADTRRKTVRSDDVVYVLKMVRLNIQSFMRNVADLCLARSNHLRI